MQDTEDSHLVSGYVVHQNVVWMCDQFACTRHAAEGLSLEM